MIIYSPRYIVAAGVCGTSIYEGGHPWDYLPLYEHFARKVVDWNLPSELLVDTSGIHLTAFAALDSQDAAATVLAKLFAAAGTSTPRGRFLGRCGIRRWADLARPIRIQGRECKARVEYDVRERRLREPGPNEYHPGAVFAQACCFQFGYDRKWRFLLRYGYSHDSSSWTLRVRQTREALSTFVRQTVPRWLDSVLMPETWSANRMFRNRRHDLLISAVDALFGWGCFGPSPGQLTTDVLVQDRLDCDRKPHLTARRLGVLRRWAQADARRAATKKGASDGK